MNNDSKLIHWQNLDHNRRMEFLLTTEHLSDCSFTLLNDKEIVTIRGHTFVFMCASPVFERMFYAGFEEASKNIKIEDVSADDFKAFMKYIYIRDECLSKFWDEYTLQSLIYLGKKFKVDELTELCFLTIIKRISKYSPDELINLYEYAHEMEHNFLISEIVWQFQQDPFTYFDCPEVLELSSEFFLCFIKHMNFHTHTYHRNYQIKYFNLIEKYCQKNGLINKAPGSVQIQRTEHEGKELLKSQFKSTIGDDTKANHETQNKKTINKEKKMLHEVKKGNEGAESEEAEEAIGNDVKKKEYIAKLLSFVKFTDMDASQFCNGPGVSSIMDLNMKYNSLVQIAIQESRSLTFTNK